MMRDCNGSAAVCRTNGLKWSGPESPSWLCCERSVNAPLAFSHISENIRDANAAEARNSEAD